MERKPKRRMQKAKLLSLSRLGSGNLDVAKALLDHGISPKTPDGVYGETPLHSAARSDNVDLAALLVSSGADVNAKGSHNGQTPLFYAAHTGDLEMVKFLASKGADLHAKDKEGKSAMTWATEPAKDLLRSLGLRE